MASSAVVVVLVMLAGGLAPEPAGWFGRIVLSSGAPLGVLLFTRGSAAAVPVMGPVEIEAPPPPRPPPGPRVAPPGSGSVKPPPKKAL